MTDEGTGAPEVEGTTLPEVPAPLPYASRIVQFQLDPGQDPNDAAEKVGNIEVTVTTVTTNKIFVSERGLMHAAIEGGEALERLIARAANSSHDETIHGWTLLGPLGDTIAQFGVQFEPDETSGE